MQAIRFPCFEFTDDALAPLAPLRSGNEMRFFFKRPGALLPIHHQGENRLVAWGNKKLAALPRTGFCKIESIEAGKWKWLIPLPVRIIASAGWAKGTWFQVRQGIRGMLVHDQDGHPHCYVVTQPATHYFKIMTGADRMPMLLDQIL